ncbi:MAG: putative signal peptide peptidase SppA [Syntrophomonadaceae bacterium]|nr:putative signal peptide peptidase SppA [Bacillota bacterium]
MKRSKWVFWALCLLVVGSLAVTALLFRERTPAARGNIGVITLTGAIAETGGGGLLATEGITPDKVRELLKQVENDAQIAAVVLRLNSPGGSVGASQEIAALIRDFPRPVVVSMADTATSGGLYIAVFADRIVAQAGTITGSIGVITSHIYLGELYERLGITAEIVTAGEHKGLFSEPLTPERRELLQDLLDDLHAQFIGSVAEGRKLAPVKVREMATGEVFTGARAKDLGLVDRLGGLPEAVEEAAQLAGVADPQPVDITLPVPPWWETLGRFPASVLDRLTTALLGKDALFLQQQLEKHLVPRW